MAELVRGAAAPGSSAVILTTYGTVKPQVAVPADGSRGTRRRSTCPSWTMHRCASRTPSASRPSRLTLAEFSERVEAALTARVGGELARVQEDLPAVVPEAAGSRRKPARFTAASALAAACRRKYGAARRMAREGRRSSGTSWPVPSGGRCRAAEPWRPRAAAAPWRPAAMGSPGCLPAARPWLPPRVAAVDRIPHDVVPEREFDRHLVTAVGKLDVCALGHAVVVARYQQNPHVLPPCPDPDPSGVPRLCHYGARHAIQIHPHEARALRCQGRAAEAARPG